MQQLQERCGEAIEIVAADVAREEGIAAVSATAEQYATIDGIVHAAASLIEPANYQTLSPDDIVSDMRSHVGSPIALNNALNTLFNSARIVYIDSYSASDVRVGWGGYSIVKAAAQMAARLAHEELKQAKVIRVFPGAVRTQLLETVLNWQTPSPVVDTYSAFEAAGEIAEPTVVGQFIANILCNASNTELDQREYWDISRPDDHLS